MLFSVPTRDRHSVFRGIAGYVKRVTFVCHFHLEESSMELSET